MTPWQTRVFPAHAGVSPLNLVALSDYEVFPARAGVSRSGRSPNRLHQRIPRASGGGPEATQKYSDATPVFPAHAGRGVLVIDCLAPTFPARAGVGPKAPRTSGRTWHSPHTRGWARYSQGILALEQVLPAPAGVGPIASVRNGIQGCFPRTRGGGPRADESRSDASRDFPAHAGVGRNISTMCLLNEVFPAPAGVGPRFHRALRSLVCASPHTRG